MRARIALLIAAICLAAASPAAAEYRLAPYKDDLFAYKKVLARSFGGDYILVEYVEARDVGQRDKVALKEVNPDYVSLDVRKQQRDLAVGGGFLGARYLAVGKIEGGAKLIVIFLHGASGNRKLAMEDLRFGGNFNRLKNLLARNDGLYLTPDLVDFEKRGKNDVKALMKAYAGKSPDAPIVVACASTGCDVAFRLIADPESARLLGGVVLIGSLGKDQSFFTSPAMTDPAARIPVYVAHGTEDQVASWSLLDAFFRRVKEAAPDYPIRFALFDTANHGIPIRMIDWRLVLNWMLEKNAK